MATTLIDGENRGHDAVVRKFDSRPTSATPIDWSHLSRFTLGDTALEHEVLGLFAMDAPRYLAKMVAARHRKDWIEAAHTLKGSARAVGAWNVAECAQAAEALQLTAGAWADVADIRGMAEVLERLGRAVRGTVAYIEQLAASECSTSAQ
jgi:HPt (histidine-containing phosphotransfer) domain-containing protein